MGAPVTGIKAAEDPSAEALFSAFDDGISSAEKRRHATVYNYWLSIRGDRQFPPIRDLDPPELRTAIARFFEPEVLDGEAGDG